MRPGFRHIVPLLLILLLSSCSGKRNVIPRSVMADIYADMFIADQWLEDHSKERSRADTMLFYDPVFRRYGYTFEDYDRSVQYYMKDPERFSKIFRDASNKIKEKTKKIASRAEQYAAAKAFNEQIKGYLSKDFQADTFLWKAPVTDSLILDSLRRDSLRLDSIRLVEFRLDSLRRDSLYRDSLERMRLKHDSLMRKLNIPEARDLKITNIKR